MVSKNAKRQKRKLRIRAKVSGTAVRPRLAVYKSNTGFVVQLIDDTSGKTIIGKRRTGKNTQTAKELGSEIAVLAKQKNITIVVFDRGGYRYHGAVEALARAAREGGLKF
jgi:large subunit ribosomal protein L18